MVEKLETWESPNAPSGELEKAFKLAEKFRAAEHAPAIRVDHFLLALILIGAPYRAKAILKIFEEVRDEWLKEIE